MEKKLPVGIQAFEKLRTDGFLCVDKTEYISVCKEQRAVLSEPA